MIGNELGKAAVPPAPRLSESSGFSAAGTRSDDAGQLVHSGLAVLKAADRVTRELYGAPLKRPGRGVPPPRSGPPRHRVRHETRHRN
jgi:hypothetical protein